MDQCNVTLQDVMQELKALRNDMVSREEFHAAFPLNTIGKPDVDGHRTSHEAQIVSAKNLENYKTKVVEKVLLWGVTTILAVFGFGLGPHAQEIVEQVVQYVSAGVGQ